MNDCSRKKRIFVGVSRLFLQSDAVGIDPEFGHQLAGLERFGRASREDRRGAGGEDNMGVGVSLGQPDRLDHPLALVENGLSARSACIAIHCTAQNDDPVWLGHVSRRGRKAVLERRYERQANRSRSPDQEERARRDRDGLGHSPEPAPRENGAEESRDNQQADRATDHPKELRRDKEQSVSPKAILGARVMTGGEACRKPKACPKSSVSGRPPGYAGVAVAV